MRELLGRNTSNLLKEFTPRREPDDGEVFLDVLALHNVPQKLKEAQGNLLRMTKKFQHIKWSA